MISYRFAIAVFIAWSVTTVGSTHRLSAGLSPENVIVVVNGGSYESRTLANEYVHLRDVPSNNVVVLNKIPNKLVISLKDFKAKILEPLLKEIETRGLTAQTQVIAYSAGFPTTVGIRGHTDRLSDPRLKQFQRNRASINGLTYFYRFVLSDDHRYLEMNSNLYCRGYFNRHFVNPFNDSERRDRFRAADKLYDLQDFALAAEEFEQLFSEAPHIPPLALRAAEARMQDGDQTAAKELVLKAISAGWDARRWFEKNDVLEPLLENPPLSSLSSRLSDRPIDRQEPIAFSSQRTWSVSGHPQPDLKKGISYLLSCVLGVTHPRGSNIHQATQVLKTSVLGDHSHPDAVCWFTVSKDVRTKTRLLNIDPAKEWLKHLGVRAESTFGDLPTKSDVCVGLMLGTANFKLGNRKWKFVPGAIADNLTSHGGNFGNAKQTKLTALLHAGAAMSSGTVTEPYAIQAKFPLPMMYGYYASGATALEAFYLSVASPYQLLIVGDPLAQAYARAPADQMQMRRQTKDGQQLIQLERAASESTKPSTSVAAMELYVEGKLARVIPPVKNLKLNLPEKMKGATEIRTVLVGRDRLQPRISMTPRVEQKGEAMPSVTVFEEKSKVRVQCAGAKSIELRHHRELIGKVNADSGEISIDQKKWGAGPLRVRPVAAIGDQSVNGRPEVIEIPVEIIPPEPPK